MTYLGLEQQLVPDINIEGNLDNFEKFEFNATQGQDRFTINTDYEPAKFLLYINGYLIPENEYYIEDYQDYFVIVLDETLNLNDVLVAILFGDTQTANATFNVGIGSYTQEFTVTNVNSNTFPVTYSNDISTFNNSVYADGIRLTSTEYTVSNNVVQILDNNLLTLNGTITVESLISDQVYPSEYKINLVPREVGTQGYSPVNVNGPTLELRKIKSSSDISVHLTNDNEIELKWYHSDIQYETYTANGNTAIFNLQYQPYTSYSSLVTVDGIVQVPNVNYTVNSIGQTIELGSIPPNGTKISIIHLNTVSNNVTLTDIPDNYISNVKLQDNSITPEKIYNPWVFRSASFSAYSRYKYLVDTTNNNVIVQLPDVRNEGDFVSFINVNSGNANILTLIPSPLTSDTIDGQTIIELTNSYYLINYIYSNGQWRSIVEIPENSVRPNQLLNVTSFKTSNFTAENGYEYLVDATSNDILITLPQFSINGDKITFINRTPHSSTYKINIKTDDTLSDLIDNKELLQLYGEKTLLELIYINNNWETNNLNQGWDFINSNTSLLNFGNFFVDTSVASITIELPQTSFFGETFKFHDYNDTWDSNNLILFGNTINIDTANTFTADMESGTVEIIYSGTQWKVLTV